MFTAFFALFPLLSFFEFVRLIVELGQFLCLFFLLRVCRK